MDRESGDTAAAADGERRAAEATAAAGRAAQRVEGDTAARADAEATARPSAQRRVNIAGAEQED